MKRIALALALATTSVFAQEIVLNEYSNWKMTDISSRGFTKEALYSKMNRSVMKLGASICSNRALVWAYDFKRNQNIDAGKLFLFYTKKTGEVGKKTWWYHVTPVLNEKGTIFAMDAGFPGMINTPLLALDWLNKFSGSTNCKEIKASDTDLLERMFAGYVFPETTSHGTYDCYYSITPGGFWTPATVAMGLLGKDENGKPVNYVRDHIEKDEVFQACVEASTRSIGRVFGNGKKRCEEYLGF